MIVKEILDILKNDAELKQLLNATKSDPKIYANNALYVGDCLTYEFTPLINNGVLVQSRIEINCYSSNYAKCYEILQAVQRLLITVGDSQLTNTILTIEQNGGGYLYDEKIKVHMFKAIFSVREKARV